METLERYKGSASMMPSTGTVNSFPKVDELTLPVVRIVS
jgi:hypothetical protein